MNIAVVLRQVPDLIEPLEIADSETALDLDEASFLVNESDDHALEQALVHRVGFPDLTGYCFLLYPLEFLFKRLDGRFLRDYSRILVG